MVTTVLERYDSESGQFAEIKRCPDGDIIASLYGSSFEPILERVTTSVSFARKTIEAHISKPYTKTTLKEV